MLENITNIYVLMAGTDIQEYFIKNNIFFCFGGICGSPVCVNTDTHRRLAISHIQYSHSGIALQINRHVESPPSRNQATNTKFVSGTKSSTNKQQ